MPGPDQQISADLPVGAAGVSRQRRSMKNFFVKPKFQLKYGYYMVAGGFAFFGSTAAYVHYKLAQIEVLLNQHPVMTPMGQNLVAEIHSDITSATLIGFASYVIFSFIYSLLLSHRVSGPMIAITQTIEQLQNGNYSYRRNLRKGDELGPIMDGLHDLAANLEEQR
jgi:methyl-accepting chemotaxis protein